MDAPDVGGDYIEQMLYSQLHHSGIVSVPVDALHGVGPRVYVPVGQRLFPMNIGAVELSLTTGAAMLPVSTVTRFLGAIQQGKATVSMQFSRGSRFNHIF